MNCQKVGMIIADLARGVEPDELALAHVKDCSHCGALFAEQERLTAGLAAWARSSLGEEAPAAVEEKLLRAFRQSTETPLVRKRAWLPYAAGGAIAASALLFRLLTASNPTAPVPIAPVTPQKIAAVAADRPEPAPVALPKAKVRRAQRRSRPVPNPEPAPVEAHFLPVSQGDGWTPLDGGRVVRVQLPRSALLVFGLPMNQERAFEQVQADVMLSNDGLLRAIRFVQ